MTDNIGVTAAPPGAAVPAAQHQTALAPEAILHSASAGCIVERTGQLKNAFRSEGRRFARELAEHITTTQVGVASVFVYEETFGTKDRIHWLIHMKSLLEYDQLVQMGSRDEAFRDLVMRNRIPDEKGGGSWDMMFLDASLHETVLLPQAWKMYGTAVNGAAGGLAAAQGGWDTILPPAALQCSLAPHELLHSANAGMLIHRTAQLKYEFRSEGRQFAREVIESINSGQVGVATAFLYEEAFGPADRIHWLIHMKNAGAYYSLIEMHVKDEAVREMYFRDRIPPEKGGGNWSRMFVEGSIVDTALTPQHWGMYATKR